MYGAKKAKVRNSQFYSSLIYGWNWRFVQRLTLYYLLIFFLKLINNRKLTVFILSSFATTPRIINIAWFLLCFSLLANVWVNNPSWLNQQAIVVVHYFPLTCTFNSFVKGLQLDSSCNSKFSSFSQLNSLKICYFLCNLLTYNCHFYTIGLWRFQVSSLLQ